jgi:hypothetical protein
VPFHSGEIALHLCGTTERVTDFNTWGSYRQAGLEKDEAL